MVLLSAAGLYAQSQDTSGSPRVLKPETFVRRFSAGLTMSILGLPLMREGTNNIVTTDPPVDSLYTSKSLAKRFGWGITGQVAVSERFAVNVNVLVRHVGYTLNSDIISGIDNPLTDVDERTYTVHNEDTRARLYDVPVVVRFFSKGRHTPGPRVFVEGGAALRRVSHIKTMTSTYVDFEQTECCNYTPAKPELKTVRGMVAGFGVHLIDGIGIRVIPEVRYTRWMGDTFQNQTAISQRNQVEGMLSISF